MGRFLGPDAVRALAEQTKVSFRAIDITQEVLGQDQIDIVERLREEPCVIKEADAALLTGHALLRDLQGRPALLLIASLPRDIMAQGRVAAWYASVSLSVTGALIAIFLVIWFAVHAAGYRNRTAQIEALVARRTEELRDLIEWLGELVRQVDSSLLDEWEELVNPDPVRHAAEAAVVPPAPRTVLSNPRAFMVLVRNEMFRRVQLAARDDAAALGELDGATGMDAAAWGAALDDYYDEHDSIGTGPDARSASYLLMERGPELWKLRQVLEDPAGDRDWGIEAEVDLAASAEQGLAVVRVTAMNRL
jgi:hypothetical protein